MERLSTYNREKTIDRLKNDFFDVLIIGGGITGSGIALDAASRGLNTALIEKNDFASGTSSRSTKLIHGGLRYLKQFEIMLVREMGHERTTLHKLAPHLVRSGKMMLPILKGGVFGKFTTSIGLMIYDLLAGVKRDDRRKILSREETLALEPLLESDKLEGSVVYAEYRTDDARLTIEVMKTAVSYGTTSMNYIQAVDFLYNDGLIVGVKAKDFFSGDIFEIKARRVVSAAGPWVDELRKINNSFVGKKLHLSKGVHIVVPHEKFPVSQAIYFNAHDERMIFAIPRGQITYIGTTDTDYRDRPSKVTALEEDLQYLLKAVNSAFQVVSLKKEDVISSWAGLRPLIHEEGKDVTEMSRKDEIFTSDSGLISIAGGKLTGYRKMAQKIVDILMESSAGVPIDLTDKKKHCLTATISLEGGDFGSEKELEAFTAGITRRLKECGLSSEDARYLVFNYGKQSNTIIDSMRSFVEEVKDPELRMVKAEVLFTIEHELVHCLTDFFVRRTGRMFFMIESVEKYYLDIADYFATLFQWDRQRLLEEVKIIEAFIFDSRNFPSS